MDQSPGGETKTTEVAPIGPGALKLCTLDTAQKYCL